VAWPPQARRGATVGLARCVRVVRSRWKEELSRGVEAAMNFLGEPSSPAVAEKWKKENGGRLRVIKTRTRLLDDPVQAWTQHVGCCVLPRAEMVEKGGDGSPARRAEKRLGGAL
jgi:hypothetical protein